jgi:hypothetical protein
MKTWRGPLANIGIPSADRRVFSAGALSHRPMPLPLLWQEKTGQSHGGAVIVARILVGFEEDHQFSAGGDWLPVDKFSYVEQAQELVRLGVVGPSVDLEPDFTVSVDTSNPESPFLNFTKATIMGATLVPMAAFGAPRLVFEESEDTRVPLAALSDALLASTAKAQPDIVEWASAVDLSDYPFWDREDIANFAVNGSSWRSMPIAGREDQFDADDAYLRISNWANGNRSAMEKAYLYSNPQVGGVVKEAFKMPLGDIYNGKMTLVYHAVYAAAALLEGAHGGLPNISDQEKASARRIITDIYKKMADHYNDPQIVAPWDQEEKSRQSATRRAMTASNAPVKPPKAWFEDPKFTGKSRIQVTEDGRVFGHAAAWDECHTGMDGVCITVPKTRTNYQYFTLGEVITLEGETLDVGTVTMGTGHAAAEWGASRSLAHYDDTGTQVAVVRAGEDKFGIWVAGALVPGLADERVAELRRSPLSGDWRRLRGNLEMIRVLAVNSPGFAILRQENARPLSLVAAGIVSPMDSIVAPESTPLAVGEDPEPQDRFGLDDVAMAAARMVESRQDRRERLEILLATQQMERGSRLDALQKIEATA